VTQLEVILVEANGYFTISKFLGVSDDVTGQRWTSTGKAIGSRSFLPLRSAEWQYSIERRLPFKRTAIPFKARRKPRPRWFIQYKRAFGGTQRHFDEGDWEPCDLVWAWRRMGRNRVGHRAVGRRFERRWAWVWVSPLPRRQAGHPDPTGRSQRSTRISRSGRVWGTQTSNSR